MLQRRRFLSRAGRLAAASGLACAGVCRAVPASSGLLSVSMAVPGPTCLPYLSCLLAVRLGADRQEGLALSLRAVGGDPLALHALQAGEVDFAAAGLPSAAVRRAKGKPLQALAPLTQVPAYTLVVQAGLKGRVEKVRDLAGRVIGVEGRTVDGRAPAGRFPVAAGGGGAQARALHGRQRELRQPARHAGQWHGTRTHDGGAVCRPPRA